MQVAGKCKIAANCVVGRESSLVANYAGSILFPASELKKFKTRMVMYV
jgi:hypothetical protein